jgi:hypothetical protein
VQDYLVPLLDFDLDLVRVAEVVDFVVEVRVAVLVAVDLLVPMQVPHLLHREAPPQEQTMCSSLQAQMK